MSAGHVRGFGVKTDLHISSVHTSTIPAKLTCANSIGTGQLKSSSRIPPRQISHITHGTKRHRVHICG
jgi:hypothetical protein